ncbi:uncharacterized protein [Parasteatoda tepidariorum]|nr:uncharacterized protein LOC107438989 isoform X2 [Parasteatoda tepidariorum]XP_015906911.2 uncharacterized protein LOC107438989 isoform X2 [Parasteatoda tepidariorum]XP_015906913.2 uncharacterized protein LOC107438989 isoform X2 [Parasteatoda tepidariorum]XP_042901076.1 uncharacterized protein LOC107438989 isoform X2 [Parasteatoda tepidariorum]XP_042901077.1 uncharacterized protein LOC107438989 isoform X2 [Parasteatoda tepidariorum]XP_042901078.1 uncharacterized protein LOC107438989 isoform 
MTYSLVECDYSTLPQDQLKNVQQPTNVFLEITTDPTASFVQKNNRRQPSEVWDHFSKIDKFTSRCLYCDQVKIEPEENKANIISFCMPNDCVMPPDNLSFEIAEEHVDNIPCPIDISLESSNQEIKISSQANTMSPSSSKIKRKRKRKGKKDDFFIIHGKYFPPLRNLSPTHIENNEIDFSAKLPTCSSRKNHKPFIPASKRLKNVGHIAMRSTSRRCALCSIKTSVHRTKWACSTCKVPLCMQRDKVPTCFQKFHQE